MEERQGQSFQFHKGTIRTNLGLEDKDENIHFNSIKVRLERHIG